MDGSLTGTVPHPRNPAPALGQRRNKGNTVSQTALPPELYTADNGVVGEAPMMPAVGDYVALLKPRVMSLVVFTGLAGLVLAPGNLHPVLALIALLCIAVGAGASGAINMWFDRDIDAGMTRTRERPIPAGRMAPGEALGFGITLAVGSVAIMGIGVNWVAAALLALTIGFYVFVYTMWLKRSTPQNIVIGGASGAFPPMIGWAAVTGDVTWMPVIMFSIIFLWTPPHFWALALYKADEYAKVGVPMLPVVAGPRATKRQMVFYSLLLVPVTILPWSLGYSGMLYGISASVLGLVFIVGAFRVMFASKDYSDAAAKALFAYSILYLFLLFAVLMADGMLMNGGL
ncbi:MAG: protoheme IX farnesyltransferase [Rhodospirillales bacterium]|nr:protoheme IX farnesyltransferase [Rhodospirillales bacterium]MBT4006673.1 protoheme IX farnesyltransferase [Rhodospirillales bacterium]MBT5075222.1 protoheme IX farnesyltransferase [Rhodospirillales bacterium]MBT5113951.1 protoheme IX farnesyltransferase [Rhodospirillales bacterium]MBT5672479.1 protoheme IX farnesyltransferase [Rhodospirillales bacterium]